MLTLFGADTTNSQKVAIALHELGLEFETLMVAQGSDDITSDWFTNLCPNQKIPVLRNEETGEVIYESGAILVYLCERFDPEGRLLPKDGPKRYEVLQGTFFQAANVGPNLGRLNTQLSRPSDSRNLEMMQIFYSEAERLSSVVDRILSDDRPFYAGAFSIADIMLYPWLVHGIRMNFPAMMSRPRLPAWIDRIGERSKVQLGMAEFTA